MIKVDKSRKLIKEESGYYWTWEGKSGLRVYFKEEGDHFHEGSVYVKLQETPPEKPRVLADGWYIMTSKRGECKMLLEKKGDATYDLDNLFNGSIHLFDVVSGPVDFGKGVKNG